MTMVKIKFLLPLLNRLELIVLQSKENVAGKKTEKKSLFLISQFQLLQLLTPAFFSLVTSACNSIIDYEDINIFGDRKTTFSFFSDNPLQNKKRLLKQQYKSIQSLLSPINAEQKEVHILPVLLSL